MIRNHRLKQIAVVAMDEVLYKTIDKYYNILAKTGYRSYNLVYLLVILSFIQELTELKYVVWLNYDDIRKIIELLGFISDKLCEYYSNKEIDFRDFLDGHWLWENKELWLQQQIFVKDKTICESSEI